MREKLIGVLAAVGYSQRNIGKVGHHCARERALTVDREDNSNVELAIAQLFYPLKFGLAVLSRCGCFQPGRIVDECFVYVGQKRRDRTARLRREKGNVSGGVGFSNGGDRRRCHQNITEAI